MLIIGKEIVVIIAVRSKLGTYTFLRPGREYNSPDTDVETTLMLKAIANSVYLATYRKRQAPHHKKPLTGYYTYRAQTLTVDVSFTVAHLLALRWTWLEFEKARGVPDDRHAQHQKPC